MKPSPSGFGLGLMLALFALSTQVAAAGKATPKQVFGAIAHHRPSGSLGYAYDFANSRAARIEALKQCGHAQCLVVVTFRNACGAVANGPARTFTATGATRQEAETKVMKACAVRTCEPVAWACTK